uniref:RNase H type-1 domain-containing protein n=1 Tax=Cannabis sativa TaxID=3483 RepID=A0A803QBL9_CANSA
MYRHSQQRKEDDLQLVGSDFWGKLWRLKVLPKVKDLLWRAASNCLPTKVQLRHRHVNIDSIFPVCSLDSEIILHHLVECSFARACWVNTRLGVTIDYARTFTEKSPNVAVVTLLATRMLEQWSKAQDKSSQVFTVAFLTAADGAELWKTPAAGEVKINIDVALFYFMLTGTVTPELAEAMGVREALSWLKRKGWHRVTIETDCLIVVQALRSPLPMFSYFGSVISDCKTLLKDVNDVFILFVKRSDNGVAHTIARASS